jgi:hypothetical protein
MVNDYVCKRVGGENVPHSRRIRGRRRDGGENEDIFWKMRRCERDIMTGAQRIEMQKAKKLG